MKPRKTFFYSLLLTVAVTNFCFYSYSQTGPAGVGSSTNNVVWLKADESVYEDAGTTLASDGDRVQQWNDKSGNTKNVTEAAGGQQPNYETNVINGLPVIRFDGSNDRLSVTSVSTAGAASIWVVASYSSLPSTNPGLIQGSPSGSMFSTTTTDKAIGIWVENTGLFWGRGVQSGGTQKNISKVTTLSASTNYILNTIYNGTATINQYVNNAAAGNVAYDGTLKSWSDFGIGRQGGETWAGDIAEVIVYNTTLNAMQRILIDNYLASKYNITLSSNDIYTMDTPGNGNHDYEVTGIGRASDGSTSTDGQGSGDIRINNPSGLTNGEYLVWGHDNGTMGQSFSDLPAGVQVSLGRTWRASETGEVGTVDITIDLSGLGSVTASDLFLMIDKDGDGLFADETAGTGGLVSGAVSLGGGLYKFSGIDVDDAQSFSIGSGSSASTPLPVELLEFTAKKDGDNVKLVWKTATEINNDFFTVERSKNGASFEEIGKVKGSGNSSSSKEYSLLDDNPFEGTSYYRLKQTDYDGKNETFQMVSIYYEKIPGGGCILKVFPNPCFGQCSIALEDCDESSKPDIEMEVIDAAGNKVYSKMPYRDEKGLFNFQIDTENNLKPGIYIVHGANKKESYSKKIIVK